ncbi:Detected protein of unknown function [Hibiscus syriacus]|uniref:Desiccation-related protein PCC13-62 n=1 Tax=Hibiscus syriacus TaxID=106335 RepID=A0A6A2Z3X2_HIBSY|nr:desiccation-related protein PCC13-62-like [Hibiscus syriacus]KAE8686119.1 Detected protein of unknown function [Hibiscus syriacus]
MATRSCSYAFLLLVAFQSAVMKGDTVRPPPQCRPVPASTLEKIEFVLNLIVYRAEIFLRSSVGRGINGISPGLVQGPVPIGATVAELDGEIRDIIEEFGLSGVGHIRAIVNVTEIKAPVARPQLNFSRQLFSDLIDVVLNGSALTPPFDVYGATTNFLFVAADASSLLQQYLLGIIPSVVGDAERRLVAGIALKVAAEFGVIRAQLYGRANSTVSPYKFTVANLTMLISQLVNQLAGCGVKDEGLMVPLQLGAENRTTSNVVPADVYSLASPRYERELLKILFGTGNATRPGGFFPSGFNGTLFRRIQTQGLS